LWFDDTSVENVMQPLAGQKMLRIRKTNVGQCAIRSRTVSSQLSLKKHEGKYKYVHETCHKEFGSKFSLVRHTKVHSKEKDFACSFCNRKFQSKFNQERHEKRCK
jgi:uncharacterized Zn-finger protein